MHCAGPSCCVKSSARRAGCSSARRGGIAQRGIARLLPRRLIASLTALGLFSVVVRAAALKPQGLLLTAALSQGYGGDHVPASVFAHFDFVNVMAYDATGPWNPKAPGQHSSLEFAQSNVRYWLDRGLEKSKAVLGVPLYGYGFGAAYRKDEYPYREIVNTHPGAENADPAGDTIWFNGLPTLKAKAAFVRKQSLGGVMNWSLDSDAPAPRSALRAIYGVLH